MSKFCKDCRYVDENERGISYWTCKHPTSRQPEKINFITGETDPAVQSYCLEVRLDRTLCSRSGKYWEAKYDGS